MSIRTLSESRRTLLAVVVSPIAAPLAVLGLNLTAFLGGYPLFHVGTLAAAFRNGVLIAGYTLPLAYIAMLLLGLPILHVLNKRHITSRTAYVFSGLVVGALLFVVLGPLLLTADDACGEAATCGVTSLLSARALPHLLLFTAAATSAATVFAAIAGGSVARSAA